MQSGNALANACLLARRVVAPVSDIAFISFVIYFPKEEKILNEHTERMRYGMQTLDHSQLTDEERLVLKRLEQALATTTSATLLVGVEEEAIELPGAVVQILQQIVQYIGEGKMFFTIDGKQDLTTQEAANMLQVSRPYLIKLLEQGEMPFTKVGLHRRVRFQDIMSYLKRREKREEEGLHELSRLSQEYGLYD